MWASKRRRILRFADQFSRPCGGAGFCQTAAPCFADRGKSGHELLERFETILAEPAAKKFDSSIT
jgi:hypothetical protein